MFTNRRSSQKPDEEFYAAFRQNFPGVGPGTSSAGTLAAAQRSASLSEALIDGPPIHRHFGDIDDNKDQEATPKGLHDAWRLTPSLMDPNSFAFNAFVNQPPGYYTPTPAGINTLYHSQAGDLHTPGMGMNTPLSLPQSVHGIHASDGTLDLQHFQPHLIHQQFHNPFAQQQSYAPHHFLQHEDSGYVAMEHSPLKTTPNQKDASMGPPSATQQASGNLDGSMNLPMLPMGEKFRYHTTLNAPTAMIRQADEIPITYLNKGQAYTMSIYDTTPPSQSSTPLKYRTYVRISFEDDHQRERPGACWQLWKEGRGTNEAHQRGGKLLAVEYVDPNQGGDDDLRKSQIEVEKASFDGFCVTWSPIPGTGSPDCSISVRFNFLSTDFSHSKGVKGIPVRLCAKTELISATGPGSANQAEVCFSKVKLFRDHGAERKLSNDVAHVKKTIDKLKQQITQAESGVGNIGKRKRSGSMAKASAARPGKVLKHKRTWSIDSEAEIPGRLSAEEDLHVKLASMQDMFSSTRPVSVLYLRGDPEDDPDAFPVVLPGDGQDIKPLSRQETWESKQSIGSSPTSHAVSPTPSSVSNTSPKRKFSEMQQPTIPEEIEQEEYAANQALPSSPASPVQAVKVPLKESATTPRSSIMAFDVDNTYQAPTERPIRPVACFYVRAKYAAKEYYRAVYLMQRSVTDLVNGISEKFNIEAHRVAQVTHVNARGLHIIVDEDVVRELPEGQDMIVEFAPSRSERPVKAEFMTPALSEVMVDNEVGSVDPAISDPLEMWLNY